MRHAVHEKGAPEWLLAFGKEIDDKTLEKASLFTKDAVA